MERRIDAGEFRTLSKKEQLSIQREIDKLNRRIGGLKTMRKQPDLVFVVDTALEDLAVQEANKLKIPILGMVDTNADPDPIDYVIPSNDDAIRSVKLIVSVIANAAEEGLRIREVDMAETGQVSRNELAEMEQYLGPSTLAKLQATDDYEDGEFDDTYEDLDEVELVELELGEAELDEEELVAFDGGEEDVDGDSGHAEDAEGIEALAVGDAETDESEE
jgi:small subunit ribosomal protein S2